MPLSPNGRWVAFVNKDSLNLASVEGDERREIFHLAGGCSPLSWAPDSRYVLCRNGRDVWRIPALGGDAHKLAIPVNARQLVVHPDGKRVVIGVKEPGSEIWVMENFLPALKTNAEVKP